MCSTTQRGQLARLHSSKLTTSCCRCACRSITRRMASFRRPLRSWLCCLSSVSAASISSASRCRASIRCFQSTFAWLPAPVASLCLPAPPPLSRCFILALRRSVADGDCAEAALLARGGSSNVAAGGCCRQLLSVQGAELACPPIGDANPPLAGLPLLPPPPVDCRRARRSSGVNAAAAAAAATSSPAPGRAGGRGGGHAPPARGVEGALGAFEVPGGNGGSWPPESLVGLPGGSLPPTWCKSA